MKNIVLIDGYSLIFRAYYAMPSLVSSAGTPTGAVYGFANMLMTILEAHPDAVIAVAYDRSEKTFRHEMFSDYKGNRKETDEDLKVQFPIVREMLQALGIPVIEKSGFEADDIIGTLAKKVADAGGSAYVYTGDKDSLQLVQYGIKVHITVKGVSNIEEYDEAKVFEKMGVTSSQVIDFKSLRGDASDNIPGAKGIGDKTAVKLLAEYGTTENIIAHADEIKPARISSIIKEYVDVIRMSKTLATIILDVPVAPEELEKRQPDVPAVKTMFRNLGFASLLKKLDRLTGNAESGAEANPDVDSNRGGVAKTERKSGGKTQGETYGTVNSYSPFLPQDFAPDTQKAEKAQFVDAFDFSEPFTMGIALEKNRAWGAFRYAYFYRDGQVKVIRDESAFLALKDVLENAEIAKSVFSSKELYLYCFSQGISLAGVVLDIVIAAYLANPARKAYGLQEIASDYGLSVQESGAGMQLSLLDSYDVEGTEKEEVLEQAAVTAALAEILKDVLVAAGLKTLYDEVELPLVKVLADIEFTGFSIDVGVLREMEHQLAAKIAELERRIHEQAGEEFNISSPKQLGYILFEKLGLPSLKKNKTGYSTDKDVLEKLGEYYEIARLVIEYRSYTKLKSNYIDSLISLEREGKIHTSLNQTIAVTGRLSSTEQKLQNNPIRIEE
ncbi:MAG: DNA polymerase, partial [Bacillota bacterium]|nr:DNA polymerase [Bacillota bacterium]